VEIDKIARAVQIDVWKRRFELWNGNPPTNLIEIFEPSVALAARGYDVRSVSSLGDTYVNGVKSEVAGIIDRGQRNVSISQRFVLPSQRFTLAHELGHEVCHPGETGMHRDVPVDKSGVSRSWKEIEADRFASSFLMPEQLIREQFGACFRVSLVEPNDEVAHALCGTDADHVRRQCKNLRGLSSLVAGSGHFNGKHFLSMASQFRVSNSAMAIRLEGLGLVKFNV
jgi:Zn-dependent peptidase ImmA (M78 family)